MKLKELNSLVEKKNFFGVKKNLEKHIDKLESDAKEVRLDVVASIETLANKVMDRIEGYKKEQESGKLPDVDFDKTREKIAGFQKRFMDFIRQYRDNEFQKETIKKVIAHLENLVAQLEDSMDDIDELEKNFYKDLDDTIRQASGGKARLKRKLPQGLAQDINTRKHRVEHESKK
jgi:hypothetical protein